MKNYRNGDTCFFIGQWQYCNNNDNIAKLYGEQFGCQCQVLRPSPLFIYILLKQFSACTVFDQNNKEQACKVVISRQNWHLL